MYNRYVKIDLKFSSVCEKMSENRRLWGDFFDSHCRWHYHILSRRTVKTHSTCCEQNSQLTWKWLQNS